MELYFHEVHRDILVLRADGGIDSFNVHEFLNQLQRLIEAGAQKLLIDCSRVGYVSSVGISALIRLHKRMAEQGGDVKLAAVQPALLRLLQLTRLTQVFHIYPTVDDALKAFQEQQT